MKKRILLLHGPNINLIGERETSIYGKVTLAQIDSQCEQLSEQFNLQLTCQQSNHEGQLIDWIHEARKHTHGIIINPGAFSHTSIALLDALNAFVGPVLEVHISNIHQREQFRHHSYISLRAEGVIIGCGSDGYELAIRRMANILK